MYASGLFPDLGLIDTAVNISLVRKVFPVLGNQDAVDLLIGYAAFCKEKEDRKMRRAFLNRSARLKFFPLTGSPLLVSAVDPLRSPPSKSAERCTPLVTLTKDHIASSLQERYANFPRVMPTEILTLYTDLSYQLRSRWSFVSSLAKVLGSDAARKWPLFVRGYTSFFERPQLELYLQRHSAIKIPVRHIIRFRFNQHRLIVSLIDWPTNSTHFFISTGLFTRYFDGRKSLRKNKSMKTLMIRFLRKLLVVLGMRNVSIYTSGVPLYLDNLLTTLFRPLAHPFLNPFSGETVDESVGDRININISLIRFLRYKPFGYQKTKKRGRIKRKIRRKLTRLGGLLD